MPKLKPNQFTLSGHLITERPILYQTEMVQANMEDRKTQTRRTKGLDKINGDIDNWYFTNITASDGDRKEFFFRHKYYEGDGCDLLIPCPYGKPGDLLWVRETWHLQKASGQFPDLPNERYYSYKADHPDRNPGPMWPPFDGWKPSIHMPKSAARIWLMVEDVRVERVQQISEEDAKAEGVLFEEGLEKFKSCWYDYEANLPCLTNPKSSFKTLWRSINGEASWKANPWVWVIKYRILSKKSRPNNEAILKNYLDIRGSSEPAPIRKLPIKPEGYTYVMPNEGITIIAQFDDEGSITECESDSGDITGKEAHHD